MSIRPLDMQVMVPKIQQVAEMKQVEEQKANVNQHQLGQHTTKKRDIEHKSVTPTNENEKSRNQFDAKEKGKNNYYKSNKKKQKKKKQVNQNESTHRIDIKI